MMPVKSAFNRKCLASWSTVNTFGLPHQPQSADTADGSLYLKAAPVKQETALHVC